MPSWKRVVVSGSIADLSVVSASAHYVQNGQVLTNPASTILSGSFSGSFAGNGANVTGIVTASHATTASFVALAQTASYVQNAVSASYVLNAVSASFASTASSADNFTVRGTLTAQTIVAQTITSSIEFVTGSTRNGSLLSNTHQFTGSVSVTGSTFLIGNVGIGTTSPTLPSGRTGLVLRPTSGQTSSEIVIQSNNNTDGTFAGLAVSNIFNDGAAVYQRANLHLRFGTNDLERMRITETGNVGIGTVAPTAKLDVSGSVNITGSLNVTGSIAVTPGVINQLTSSFAVTASYIASAAALANALTLGTGLTGTSYNGSAAVTTAISGAAALTTNLVPKWTGTGFNNSNITDTGTQVQIGAGASSGLSVAAGGVNVTGNSTFNNDVTVTGNLTVNGTATLVNSTNTSIKDQFIQIASGSTTLVDAGIIAQYNAAGSGSAFFLESSAAGTYGRWAVAYDLLGTVTSSPADEWMVTTKINASAPGAAVPTWGGATNGVGNMWVTTAGDIFIYA